MSRVIALFIPRDHCARRLIILSLRKAREKGPPSKSRGAGAAVISYSDSVESHYRRYKAAIRVSFV